MTTVRIIHPGLFTTIQDGGRTGFEHWGITVGGAVDDYAFHWANWLLENPLEASVVEVTALGPRFEVVEAGEMSLTGADFNVHVDGEAWHPGEARRMEVGQIVRFGTRRQGLRAYLGFPGGVVGDRILGSVSTDVVAGIGGLGGRALRPGDVITSTQDSANGRRTLHPTAIFSRNVRVVRGMREELFSPKAYARLLSGIFFVDKDSNAIGLRLSGVVIDNASGTLYSEGLPIGTIECLPTGELLVLMKYRGSIGGYPALAHVIQADWPRLAQWTPGMEVRFEEVSSDAARDIYRAQSGSFGNFFDERLTAVSSPFAGRLLERDQLGRLLPLDGEWVVKGELIGVLEVMGEIIALRAPHEGTLRRLVDLQQSVGPGQTVFQIKGGIGHAND